MGALYTAIGLVLVAIVTGTVSWLVARRTSSGHIDTSEAATLWDEGTAMRLELREQVALLRIQLADAVKAISELNHEIQLSRTETETSRAETRLSRAETRRLMAQIEEVHSEVKTSNAITIGALADNTETRRILQIPANQRSKVEQEHIATAGDRLPLDQRPTVPNDNRGPS